jgi:hypothetical protein
MAFFAKITAKVKNKAVIEKDKINTKVKNEAVIKHSLRKKNEKIISK